MRIAFLVRRVMVRRITRGLFKERIGGSIGKR